MLMAFFLKRRTLYRTDPERFVLWSSSWQQRQPRQSHGAVELSTVFHTPVPCGCFQPGTKYDEKGVRMLTRPSRTQGLILSCNMHSEMSLTLPSVMIIINVRVFRANSSSTSWKRNQVSFKTGKNCRHEPFISCA